MEAFLDFANWRHDSTGYLIDVVEVAGPLNDRQSSEDCRLKMFERDGALWDFVIGRMPLRG